MKTEKIELQRFHRMRTSVEAVRYEGPKMDYELTQVFQNDFRFAYDYQGGGQYLVTSRRGLKIPHRGDWLVFDLERRNLIDVMPDSLFQATFEGVKEVI